MAKPRHTHDWIAVQTDIDRKRYGHRTVPVKVLMLGLGRTGTESTTNALTRLGINEFYHGWHPIFGNPRDSQMWLEALEAKFDGKGKPYGKEEFDKLLGHCQGISDIPAILFAEELLEAYPDAKVILTYRDFDSWFKSCSESIDVALKHPINFGLAQPLVTALHRHDRFVRPMLLKTWTILFKGDFKANAREVWDEHYSKIRRLVPEQRLLEYDVKQGWDPLVKFLGVEHPGVPFPRGNSTDDLQKRAESDLLQVLGECITTVFKVSVWSWVVLYWIKRLLGTARVRYLLNKWNLSRLIPKFSHS